MKVEFLKSLGIGICILDLILGSNVKIVSVNVNTDLTNQYEENQTIVPKEIEYVWSSYHVEDVTNFPSSITLSSTVKYAKAYYQNMGTEDATLTVTDVDKITIPAGSSDYIKWTKTGFDDKTYSINVRSSSTNLDGYFSLGKSDKEF